MSCAKVTLSPGPAPTPTSVPLLPRRTTSAPKSGSSAVHAVAVSPSAAASSVTVAARTRCGDRVIVGAPGSPGDEGEGDVGRGIPRVDVVDTNRARGGFDAAARAGQEANRDRRRGNVACGVDREVQVRRTARLRPQRLQRGLVAGAERRSTE